MEAWLIGLISVVLVFALVLLGVHLAYAMSAMAVIGVWLITGQMDVGIRLLANTSYTSLMEYIYGAVPMFLLMGLLANHSGGSEELYEAAQALFGRLRGGVGITTVIANAIFAAVTGVSLASVIVFGKIAIPQMLRMGYDRRFSFGTVVGSSVLGMLIPPSLLLIVYGILAEQGIGRLFLAGLLPGILLTTIYCIGIIIAGILRPQLLGKALEKNNDRKFVDRLPVLIKPWGLILLVCLVLGGIYLGFFSPTEAGAVGAAWAFILCLMKRKMNSSSLWKILLETGRSLGGLYFLFIGATMFSRMLAFSGLPGQVGQYVLSLNTSAMTIIILFLLLFIVLGSMLDSFSIMMLTLPVMIPVLNTMQVDLIWFGIIATVALEMGMLTPPFGTVVFALKATMNTDATVEEIFIGAFPFLFMMVITLIILIMFPSISVWLPSVMLGE